MNIVEAVRLKYPNAIMGKDVVFRDHGGLRGVEMAESDWHIDAPYPTKDEIEAWKVEFDLALRQRQAVEARVYPDVKDQLDMLYKDMLNGTSVFKSTISGVKNKSPKPLI